MVGMQEESTARRVDVPATGSIVFFFFYNFEFFFVNRRKLSSDVKDMMFFEFKINISQKIKTYKNFEKVCILSQTVSSGVTRQFFPKPIIGGGGSSRG